MITTQYSQGAWTMMNDTVPMGFIEPTQPGQSGKFVALLPRPSNGHKGGLSQIIGTYDTFEEAQAALVEFNNTKS
jgi:hypothetical protein